MLIEMVIQNGTKNIVMIELSILRMNNEIKNNKSALCDLYLTDFSYI